VCVVIFCMGFLIFRLIALLECRSLTAECSEFQYLELETLIEN